MRWSEEAARTAGLTPALHQLLLAVRGARKPEGPTIGAVADALLVRHHTAVELAQRAEAVRSARAHPRRRRPPHRPPAPDHRGRGAPRRPQRPAPARDPPPGEAPHRPRILSTRRRPDARSTVPVCCASPDGSHRRCCSPPSWRASCSTRSWRARHGPRPLQRLRHPDPGARRARGPQHAGADLGQPPARRAGHRAAAHPGGHGQRRRCCRTPRRSRPSCTSTPPAR